MVVYVKESCALCGPVLEAVEQVRRDVAFSLEVVDISSNPELIALHGLEVPVVTINGRKAFKGRMAAQDLRKKLKRAHQTVRPTEALTSLESIESDPYIPPRPIAALLIALTLFAFAYVVNTGFDERKHGRLMLTGSLLRVEARDELPVGWELPALKGGQIKLADLRGKVVFINFWATWCPPCIEEMPSMIRLQDRMKQDEHFLMLAISADEGWEPVRRFFEKGPPPFTVLLDAKGKKAAEYGTTMFPETYIVIDGRVRGFIEGPRNWDDWYAEAYLRELIEAEWS